jgi:hypothetical protein
MDYWWDKYEIIRKYTDMYDVSCVRDVHFIYANKMTIIVPKTLCIGYSIGEFVKTYMPFESKELKFRNNYPSTYVEGHVQIDWTRNDLLVITKSLKECIFFRNHWDIQAVSGKSETTMIPYFLMCMYIKHFKRVLLWLDPDEAGLKATATYLNNYPTLEVAKIPRLREKDPTDIFEVHRKQLTTEIVLSALNSINQKANL